MIARGFKSVIWVATVGSAALACYMVSLQVATERADLEKVERQIIAAKQSIRSLQTELGTRGRLSQLENWNAEVLALSAPTSAQFLQNEFTLARFERREPIVADQVGEVRMAALQGEPHKAVSAGAPVIHAAASQPAPVAGQSLVRRASYVSGPSAPGPAAEAAPAKPKAEAPAKPKTEASAKPRIAQTPTPKREMRQARLGGTLAEEIGAAAHREQSGGGN